MTTMNENEVKAYGIGIKEASERGCIVPSCRSKEFEDLIIKVIGNVPFSPEVWKAQKPLQIAYEKGVAYAINRQTRLAFRH